MWDGRLNCLADTKQRSCWGGACLLRLFRVVRGWASGQTVFSCPEQADDLQWHATFAVGRWNIGMREGENGLCCRVPRVASSVASATKGRTLQL